MGRLEPSRGLAPPAFRRDARAKKAKATANKTIPALLSSNLRARQGIEATELITGRPPANASDDKGTPSPAPGKQLRISLCVADTLATARSLLVLPGNIKANNGEQVLATAVATPEKVDLSNREARVGVLNMASPLTPGGGFFNGATSQEEFLCMRTTLLPSLRDSFYRLPEQAAVFTPDVCVFRDDGPGDGEEARDLEKRDRWFVNCVSAAMLRHPDLAEVDADEDPVGINDGSLDGDGEGNGGEFASRRCYADGKDRELVLQKMRLVLSVFQRKGIRKVVLGAWGCGAYGNPIGEVATAWRKVLLSGPGGKKSKDKNKARRRHGENIKSSRDHPPNADANKEGSGNNWPGIEEVVFAIPSASTASQFEQAFGHPGLEHRVLHQEKGGSLPSNGVQDTDPDAAALQELEDKIQELEIQLQQAQSPQLKVGLGSAMAALKAQLPGARDVEEGDSGGSGSNQDLDIASTDEE